MEETKCLKARHKPDQIATIVQPNLGNFVRTLAMPKTAPLRDFQLAEVAGSRQMFADTLMLLIARAAGATRATTTKAVVRCGSRRCSCVFAGAQLQLPALRGGQRYRLGRSAEHPAALGIPPQRTTVRTTNLANIAAYVVARIALTELSGRASGEFQTNL
jgi:hypothetical protein